ncbi:MAG: CBS domain-containing protein [Kiritimatiellae bacterium]|nr:CBS domain-containing protein [Kiritimatiellia bacterium]
MTSLPQTVKILSGGESRSDDQIIAAHGRSSAGAGAALPGAEDSPLVIMELLQRLRVKDVMKSQNIISVVRTDSMKFAQNLMKRNHISGVPVVEGSRLFGIVSVNDIIKALEGDWIQDAVQQHMATNLVVLEEDMPLAFALKFFQNYTFGRFPVLNKERNLVGIVSQRDVTRAMLKELTREISKLEGRSPPAQDAPARSEGALPFYAMRQFAVVHNDLQSAGKAANEIKKMLKDAGVDPKIVRRVAVAAYELEINVCIHSLGGTVTFILDTERATVIAKDRGPGIKDVEWACQDGTSTANDWIRSMGFGAGMGLSNSKRVSDSFDIQSKVPSGTTVMCEFNLAKKEG